MKLLAIKNDGLICKEDLFLIGSSTKRDDNTKIGMFGSGWKYALAWLMRNNCNIEILSGNDVINIDTVPVKHRDNMVNVITIDGEQTSLTTEMGPDWTAWMAIREIVSNAIDEGGFEYELDTSLKPEEGKSIVYIEANDEIINMFENFDDYFSFDRPGAIKCLDAWGDLIGNIYIKKELSPMVVYRKGIRCYNNSEKHMTKFDIDLDNIGINESRLSELHDIRIKIRKIFNHTSDYNVFETIITSSDDGRLIENTHLTIKLEEHFKHAVNVKNLEFGSKVSGLMESNFGKIIIPTTLYEELATKGIVKSLFDFLDRDNAPSGFKYNKDHNFDEVGVKEALSKFNIQGLAFHFGDFHLERWVDIKVTGDGNVFINTLCLNNNRTAEYWAYGILSNGGFKFFESRMKIINEFKTLSN